MPDKKRKILVFASGTQNGGGSGFEWLVEATRTGMIPNAEVVAVASNHHGGGVRERANRLEVPFVYFSQPWDEEGYRSIVALFDPWLICLSGWLKKVSGLDPAKTINIHPGLLPEFGGSGMHGHHVHEAVMEAYRRGEITESAVSMHFVTEEYDAGPVFFRFPVAIRPDDTPETLGARANEIEHAWQSVVTALVLDGHIRYNHSTRQAEVNEPLRRAFPRLFPHG